MDPERQATAQRGTGPSVADRDRSTPVDPGLRGGGRRGRRGPERACGRPAAGPIRRGPRGQPEFRQGLHAGRRPGVVEFICAGRGDAQAGKEERGGNGTRKREAICGVAATTQRGGKRDQQPGTSRLEPVSGCGARRLSALRGLRRDELQSAPDRTATAGASIRLKPPAPIPPPSPTGELSARLENFSPWDGLRLKNQPPFACRPPPPHRPFSKTRVSGQTLEKIGNKG